MITINRTMAGLATLAGRGVAVSFTVLLALLSLLQAAPASAAPAAQTGSTEYCVNLPAVADSYIEQDSATSNRGTNNDLRTDSETGKLNRALLQFDLSVISGTIQSAQLVLNQTANSGAATTVNVHRVTSQWAETQVTWNNRITGTPWSTAGGDYDAAVLGSFTANGVATRSVDVTSLAEQWRTGAVTNFGVLLESPAASGGAEKRYASDENGTTSLRPRLEICYTGTVPQPPPPPVGAYCYISTVGKDDVGAYQYWTDNNNGTLTIRTVFAKTFVDNTYGVNAIDWPGGHTFGNLTGSDHLQLALYDNTGAKKLEFRIDYLTASAGAPSGYDSLGVTGGEGSMILGSTADVVSATTSLDVNFNTFGYVLTTDSPATDAAYTANPTYPNWIYEVWYEVTVKKAAFGTSGFGYPLIASVHASPSKTGSNTETVTPGICASKEFLSATRQGDGTWDVQYKVTVTNNGTGAGQYDLFDQPAFDDDLTINSAGFVSSIPTLGTLVGTGPWTLAENQGINAKASHVFTLTVNATLDLAPGSGGDDQYTRCEQTSIGNPVADEGFFNEAQLDRDNDGDIDQIVEDCGDIPNITHYKQLVGTQQTGARTWRVVYDIGVVNGGGITSTFNLVDQPGFDDDIAITSASYTSTVSAGGPLAGGGPWTLATDQPLGPGASAFYRVTVDVTVDLSAGSGGSNTYVRCGSAAPGNPQAGEGLYNQSLLDVDDDGQPDETSEACTDVPHIVHEKQYVGATQQPDGSYNIVYDIVVRNLGGVSGGYGLTDQPAFDDDIAINSASYTSTIPSSGSLAGSGPWTLDTNRTLTAGSANTYRLTVNATLNLAPGSGGSNTYTRCAAATPGNPQNGEGLFNESRLDVNNDGTPDEFDEACGDLPALTVVKNFVAATQVSGQTWDVAARYCLSRQTHPGLRPDVGRGLRDRRHESGRRDRQLQPDRPAGFRRRHRHRQRQLHVDDPHRWRPGRNWPVDAGQRPQPGGRRQPHLPPDRARGA